MRDHWTAEEYREFLETGREPAAERQRKVEEAWKRAVESGAVMTLEIPTDEEKPKRKKYGNRRAKRGWKAFDSEHEAKVYDELMMRVREGELKCVLRQVSFDLLEKSRLQYVADFVAIRPDMTIEGVYDAKSEITRKEKTYVVKKKLMRELWDIEIIEI